MRIAVLEEAIPSFDSSGYGRENQPDKGNGIKKSVEKTLAAAGLVMALSAKRDLIESARPKALLKIGASRLMQHAAERIGGEHYSAATSAIGEVSSIIIAASLAQSEMLPQSTAALSIASDMSGLLLDGMGYNRQRTFSRRERRQVGELRSAALIGSTLSSELSVPYSNIASTFISGYLAAETARVIREEEIKITAQPYSDSFPRCLR